MTAQFLSLNMIKDDLTNWWEYGLRFKKQNNREELPGLIPCSAHSCFQNSIPTVQDKEEKKKGFKLEQWAYFDMYKHALHGGGSLVNVNALKKNLLWFPHCPICRVIISRGISIWYRRWNLKTDRNEHEKNIKFHPSRKWRQISDTSSHVSGLPESPCLG